MADAAEENGEPLINIIQAIITDVEMPVMDGYVLTEKIKKDKRFKDIPILMHSSLSAEENIRLGMKVGVDAYISKMRPKEFSKTLNGLISKSVEKLRALKKSSAA
jgi:two-component system chemotaxis response regulator CheV